MRSIGIIGPGFDFDGAFSEPVRPGSQFDGTGCAFGSKNCQAASVISGALRLLETFQAVRFGISDGGKGSFAFDGKAHQVLSARDPLAVRVHDFNRQIT